MPQSITSLHYHIVFSTKERRSMIADDFRDRLYEYIGGILNENDSKLISVGGMPDHIHVLASINKELSISAALRLIKSNSSKWAHETFPKHRKFGWQAGYGAFAVSYSKLESVKKYIANQEKHHRKSTFKEEFKALLTKHDLNFNEKYLWD
jgi:REP element-mobilizing transposase RayT